MAKTIDELAQPPIRRAILGGGTDEAVRTRPVRLRYGAVNLSWPLLSPQSGQWTEEAGQDDHAARFHACHLAWLMIQLLYESFNCDCQGLPPGPTCQMAAFDPSDPAQARLLPRQSAAPLGADRSGGPEEFGLRASPSRGGPGGLPLAAARDRFRRGRGHPVR